MRIISIKYCLLAGSMFIGLASTMLHAGERPNLVVILADDQDKESIGAYGADVLTPNLDRLARQGMLFHRAYVSSTVCTLSRYPMKNIGAIEAGNNGKGAFKEVSFKPITFDRPGLKLIRFMSNVPKQRLQIDRIQFRKE